MHTTLMKIRAPEDFNFWGTAFSHGWCELPPFSFNRQERTLGLVLPVHGNRAVACTLSESKGAVKVTLAGDAPLSATDRSEIRRTLRSCLRMDEDFRPFHTAARHDRSYRWIAERRFGRLLRAPTVFEDLIKMICTTNCTWQLTTIMVTNLVNLSGDRRDGEPRPFPGPEIVGDMSEAFLRKHVKAGYRAPFLRDLARAVRSGNLDVESLRQSTLPTNELEEALKAIKGVGPYAAGNLLRLLGRYDRLALDSWVRKRFGELHYGGRRVSDRTIERHYAKYGEWRGLIFWLEMTRHWHEETS